MSRRLFRYIRIFWVSCLVTFAILAAVWWQLGLNAAFIALLLIILEVTFSFENAVINARVLAHMSHFWQQIFMTIGITIAVFGMRIVFPIVLVAITAYLPTWDVLQLALQRPEAYAHHLESAQPVIAAFGGMFLMMVAISYFVLENKENHWLKRSEALLHKLPNHWVTAPVLAFMILLLITLTLGQHMWQTIMLAGIVGIFVYIIIHGLVMLMQSRQQIGEGRKELVGIGGFMAFLYLELLDASFSLDGVIGAFAITSSVILIAAGLGVGAVWVRSLTVYVVRHKTLAKYIHLEQGAHWAIAILSVVLLLSFVVHLPEAITGSLGVLTIVASLISSLKRNKKALKEAL
ncbi:MAG TPA: DUF475 domain-containing protein [Candidatus Saccharimonadales bacterium]